MQTSRDSNNNNNKKNNKKSFYNDWLYLAKI